MAAYNGVNGTPMTEQRPAADGVLKGEWGFDGVGRLRLDGRPLHRAGARSAAWTSSMPALGDPWGDRLVAAVRAGEVPEEVVDDKVRRVLRLAARVGALDGVTRRRSTADLPRAGWTATAVAREVAARSFVLARNAGDLLPLDAAALTRVAVLGALAVDARVQGGGSAQVFPPHVVSPLDGLDRGAARRRRGVRGSAPTRARACPPPAARSGATDSPLTLRDAAGDELFRTRLDTGDRALDGRPARRASTRPRWPRRAARHAHPGRPAARTRWRSTGSASSG